MKKVKGSALMAMCFMMMVVMTGCHAKNNAPAVYSPPPPPITIGDTVSTLGRNLMAVFQDSYNRYWFASWEEGLYCYDGKTILHFTTEHGLCHNRVEQVQEDKAGNLYLTTGCDVCKFDGQSFATLPITRTDNQWQLLPNDLWFRGAQDSGVVYRYDGQDLHRLELPKIKLGEDNIAAYPRAQYPARQFSVYDVYTIYKDTKGNVWFGTSSLGVCRYDGKSFTWITEEDVTELHDGPANGVRSFVEDHERKFWFSNTFYRYAVDQNGNYRKSAGIGRLYSPIISNVAGDDYLAIAKDKEEVLWIVTYNAGVWRYDARQPAGKSLTHYLVKDGDKPIKLFSVYQDRQGTLWLGTHETGAYRFNGQTFERFLP